MPSSTLRRCIVLNQKPNLTIAWSALGLLLLLPFLAFALNDPAAAGTGPCPAGTLAARATQP